MSVYYLGAFPPPYGGVTRKNELLFQELERRIGIAAVNFSKIKRRNPTELARLVRALADRNARYVVGVSGRNTRRRFCRVLHRFNPRAMSRSVLMLMGSLTADDIAADPSYLADVRCFRSVYAETEGMRAILENAGLHNVAVYPNPRALPERLPAVPDASGTLRCVYFSLISEEKGADLVLAAAAQLPEIQFHFYGPVDDAFAPAYRRRSEQCANVFHHGEFNGTQDAVLSELAQYDVLLLPTKCAEGVPGVLVEGKLAGLAEVVSPFRFSRDLVSHGQDGWILPDFDVSPLVEAIGSLDRDRSLLTAMRERSLASSARYDIAKYLPGILEDLS